MKGLEPKKFAYARVSSRDQNLDRQVELFRKMGIEDRDIFVEKQSGGDFCREVYRNLVDYILRENDILIVKELDRFGRNYAQIKEEWRYITKIKRVDIIVLDMPLLDTAKSKDLLGTLIADMVLSFLSYAAQQERDSKRRAQKEGIAIARRKGVHMGRPRIGYPQNWEDWYEKRMAGKATAVQAMRAMGLKKDSYYRLLKKYEEYSRNQAGRCT